MTTFTSLEEDALTILSYYKRHGLRDGGSLPYACLRDDARSAGISGENFADAIHWLIDNGLLQEPRGEGDPLVLTRDGFFRNVY